MKPIVARQLKISKTSEFEIDLVQKRGYFENKSEPITDVCIAVAISCIPVRNLYSLP